MFSQLKSLGDKLGESVREFEANLANPNSSSSPSTPPRPLLISTSSSSRSPRPSLDNTDARPSSPLANSPGGAAAVQSASQLADQALSSLRLSFKKGRASMDSARSKSVDVPRKASEESVRKVEPAVKEEVAVVVAAKADAAEEGGRESPAEAEATVGPVETVEEPLKDESPLEEESSEGVAEEVPLVELTEAAAPSEPAAPSPPSPEAPLDPLLRPSSPEPHSSISTADATPETTRVSTPIPIAASPTPNSTSTAAEFSIPSAAISEAPSLASPPLLTSPDPHPAADSPTLALAPTPPPAVVESPPPSPPPIQALEIEEAPASVEPVSVEPVAEAIVEPAVVPEPSPELPAPSTKDPRVAEITQAYKRLQTLKSTLDRIVSELTPLSGVSDVDAFEGELRNMKSKTTMSMAEIGRLTAQLAQQKERIEEIRDMHRLETKSQSEQIDTLTSQLAEKDIALKLIASQASKADEAATAAKAEVAASVEAYDKLKIVAKEEEEKRIKALSLLRALRQKLVKSEKDKEEGERERETLKASEVAAQETLRADRQRFDQEVVSLRAAQEQQLSKLRNSFDREAAQLRVQHEREATARKGQYELDAITAKAVQAKELSAKDSRIQQLEGTVREMKTGRDALFDQLQLKTAEVESSTSHQESLEEKTGELQYELKEARDRSAALVDELEEVRRAQRDVTRDDTNTRRLLLEAEARHDTKVRDLEVRAKGLEKERQETEEEMGRNLQDRLREVERMRQEIVQKDIDYAESVQSRELRDAKIAEAETQKRALETKLLGMDAILADLREELQKSSQAEAAVREELHDRMQRASELEGRLEEVQTKESSLRSNNKTLREELRKLQSGVLLAEKQRNPGVGYFASYAKPQSHSVSSSTLPLSPTGSDTSKAPSTNGDSTGGGAAKEGSSADEALNFEYLRNVILQFVERPERRSALVSVLGVILHFTPAETRRLASKS